MVWSKVGGAGEDVGTSGSWEVWSQVGRGDEMIVGVVGSAEMRPPAVGCNTDDCGNTDADSDTCGDCDGGTDVVTCLLAATVVSSNNAMREGPIQL